MSCSLKLAPVGDGAESGGEKQPPGNDKENICGQKIRNNIQSHWVGPNSPAPQGAPRGSTVSVQPWTFAIAKTRKEVERWGG